MFWSELDEVVVLSSLNAEIRCSIKCAGSKESACIYTMFNIVTM
jgi:hypothetical protein